MSKATTYGLPRRSPISTATMTPFPREVCVTGVPSEKASISTWSLSSNDACLFKGFRSCTDSRRSSELTLGFWTGPCSPAMAWGFLLSLRAAAPLLAVPLLAVSSELSPFPIARRIGKAFDTRRSRKLHTAPQAAPHAWPNGHTEGDRCACCVRALTRWARRCRSQPESCRRSLPHDLARCAQRPRQLAPHT